MVKNIFDRGGFPTTKKPLRWIPNYRKLKFHFYRGLGWEFCDFLEWCFPVSGFISVWAFFISYILIISNYSSSCRSVLKVQICFCPDWDSICPRSLICLQSGLRSLICLRSWFRSLVCFGLGMKFFASNSRLPKIDRGEWFPTSENGPGWFPTSENGPGWFPTIENGPGWIPNYRKSTAVDFQLPKYLKFRWDKTSILFLHLWNFPHVEDFLGDLPHLWKDFFGKKTMVRVL